MFAAELNFSIYLRLLEIFNNTEYVGSRFIVSIINLGVNEENLIVVILRISSVLKYERTKTII